ncbi:MULTISPECIES: sugar-binding transcriptional regulator [Pseudomonas]|uniref:Sugar-binding transcriptional regulator n=5 Tax=Pseudomonas syringae group TaxID=136849 RepID=A0ABU7N946_PSEVI|nr:MULTISPECIES: sugar-binding transcriptional regulator [Pseudomonas]KTC09154.1 DNA-binding transcriptional regulator [Pseudomonas marginalis ICMP 11289]MCF8981789.1 sugar-binding transcriptional regulator [Pseudomonas syringae]MBD8186104.1 sugar-binding transcriptional regulator [Pseudomonas viridiflava]MBD8201223.1 sugar-binding transcriptional regulator [Pseudomonas viridiflava]MBI6576264.1 sugar-binding transcriptional regulator [Pseudomonas viridiflava]
MRMLEEQRLLTKIASLYYEDGLKQSQISQQLDLSQSFVSRALNRALKEGIVKISVQRPLNFHLDLERELQQRYGVRQVIVVEPTSEDEDALKQAIGSAAAHYIETTLTEKDRIGISSWSSTIRAMVGYMHSSKQSAATEVVQLLGGVGNKGAFEATLLTQQLATLLGCPSYLLPSQSIEQSVDSRHRILQLDEVREVVERFSNLTVAIVGIGELEPSKLLRNSGNYHGEPMLKLLAERGAVGDICLRYYDADGKPVLQDSEEVVVSVDLEQLLNIERVIGLAGGERKVNAIRGALHGGYLDVLITDLATARSLIS